MTRNMTPLEIHLSGNYHEISMPAHILHDKNLSSFQKILCVEIQVNTNGNGDCWASDRFLARKMNETKERISENITALEKLGYVVVDNENPDERKIVHKLYEQNTSKG